MKCTLITLFLFVCSVSISYGQKQDTSGTTTDHTKPNTPPNILSWHYFENSKKLILVFNDPSHKEAVVSIKIIEEVNGKPVYYLFNPSITTATSRTYSLHTIQSLHSIESNNKTYECMDVNSTPIFTKFDF